MQEYRELPESIRLKIDDLLEKAGHASRDGDRNLEEQYAIKAWELLPEPKLGWDFYSNTIPRDNMIFYRNMKAFDKALYWLEITRESYGSTPQEPNQSVEFYAATIYYEMGQVEKAYAIFDWQ